MKKRYNAKMSNYLEKNKFFEYMSNSNDEIYHELLEILNAGVTKIDECYLLTTMVKSLSYDIPSMDDHDTRTSFEFDANDVNIKYIKENKKWSKKSLLMQGFMYATKLAEILEKMGHFNIVLMFQLLPVACFVRFYYVRDDDSRIIPKDTDLNQYNNCLLVIET